MPKTTKKTRPKTKRYILVGGQPVLMYTGTTTFTGLKVYGYADTEEQMERLTDRCIEKSGCLLMWIDRQTGKAV